jgi:hypothetical protein
MREKGVILAAIALLVASAAGCGGGDSDSTAEPLTKAQLADRAEFVVKANRLCERARVKAERKGVWVFRSKARYYDADVFEQYRGSLKRQEIAIVLAPSMLRRIGEVRDLGIPPRDRRQVERILEETKEAAAYAKENPYEFLAKGSLRNARELARAYGIESCAVLYAPDGVYQKVSATL